MGDLPLHETSGALVTRPRRTVLTSAAVAAAAAAVVVPGLSSTADSAPAVRLVGVQYDSPGDDTGTNYSVNAEWFRVKNTSTRAKSLAGWKVKDNTGYTFVFPSGYTLGAGKTVTVRTGKGSNTASTLYWKQGYYVWNNTGDKARLMTPGGTVVDSCSWDDGSGYTSC